MNFIATAIIVAGLVLSPVLPAQRIAGVQSMPDLPPPYRMRDWAQVARDFDALAFDFSARGQFLPLGAWNRRTRNYPEDSFRLVSFIVRSAGEEDGEAISNLAAVLGAIHSGIDKSNQKGHNYVSMCQEWLFGANGENVYLNTPHGRAGVSFWYELLSNLLFYQLHYLHPNTGGVAKQFQSVAERYYNASVGLGGRAESNATPDFNHLSFRFDTMSSADNGIWREPDAAAAVAWLEYMDRTRTKDPRYRRAGVQLRSDEAPELVP